MNEVTQIVQKVRQAPWRVQRQWVVLFLLGLVIIAMVAWVYLNVTVRATATPEYTQHKFGGGKAAPETYVLKAGRSGNSAMAADARAQNACRVIAEALAPELARQQYWPAKRIEEADLGIVVFWDLGGGLTQWPVRPRAFLTEATVPGNKGQLLMDQPTTPTMPHPAEPLNMPTVYGSYSITLEAYDLHVPVEERKHPVWTINLTIPAVGNDTRSALKYLSAAAVDFIGRATDEPQHVRPVLAKDRIETGPVVIVGEEKTSPAAVPTGT